MAFGVRERVKEGASVPTRTRSKAQEETVAEAVGGARTPNSGATAWAKGDIITEQFLLECKTKMTSSKSMTIKKVWLEKNRQEAIFMGKPYSALVFNFGPGEENHYVIDESLFQELLAYLRTKQD